MKISFNNKNNVEYEKLFDNLIQSTFGFSFMSWFERNLWNENYESYSIIKDNKMISNICIHKTEIIIYEEKISAYQLGAVCTDKDYRGQAFVKKLMEHIIDKYHNKNMFLFANESVIDFYPKYSFNRIYESEYYVDVDINNNILPSKLNIDSEILKNYIYNERILSNKLDTKNSETITYFHLLLEYSDCVYYLPQIDGVAVVVKEGNNLFIPYVNLPVDTDFNVFCTLLPFGEIKKIVFGFIPDIFSILYKKNILSSDCDAVFVKGFSFPKDFSFPEMSKT